MFALLTLVLSLALALLAAEGIARMLGYRPWEPPIRAAQRVPHENHRVLGWRSREGSYISPPYSPSGSPIQTTFLSEGLRKTSPDQGNVRDDRPKLVFVGCSFTQGWAISDHETFPWKLQQAFPAFEVLNFGTSGYGTYQSLLTLEEQLPKLQRPRMVLYGFIADHEQRNVGSAYFLRALTMNSIERVHLPSVEMQDGALVRRTPEVWPSWPLRENSALVALAETAWMNFKGHNRLLSARNIPQHLLLEMKAVSEAHGAEFAVVLLNFKRKREAYYTKWLQKQGIAVINCNLKLTDDLRVEGEGHPNGEMNTRWSSCIAAYLEQHEIAGKSQN